MRVRAGGNEGFTLVEIMIVVAIIGLLAAIAIPNFMKARNTAQKNACINNLRQIDSAIQQWALDNKQGPTAAVKFTDISGYLKNAVICPAGGNAFLDSYNIDTVANKPTCKKVPGAGPNDPTAHILTPDTTG